MYATDKALVLHWILANVTMDGTAPNVKLAHFMILVEYAVVMDPNAHTLMKQTKDKYGAIAP